MYELLQTAFVAEFAFPHHTFFSILQLVCFLLRCSASLRLSPAETSDRLRGGKTHLHTLEISARVNLAPCSRLNIPHLLSACSLTSHTGLPPLTNQQLLRFQLFLSASKRRPMISVTGALRGAYLAEEDIQSFKQPPSFSSAFPTHPPTTKCRAATCSLTYPA